MFLLPVLIVIAICVVAGCLYSAFRGWRRGWRRLILLGGVPFAVLSTVVAILVYDNPPPPKSAQARDFMSLPADAQVVDVHDLDGGDAWAYFRFPPTRSVRSRFESVWAANLKPGARHIANVISVEDARHGRVTYVPEEDNDVPDLWRADARIRVKPGFVKTYRRKAAYSDGGGDSIELSYDGETHLYKFDLDFD